jgi:outer membrane protein assembly factor BamA
VKQAGLLLLALPFLLGPPVTSRAEEPTPGATKTITVRKSSISAYPYAYYTPESQLAVGVGGILTFYTAKHDSLLNPSSLTLSAYYTTNDQYKLSATPKVYISRNRYLIKAPFSYGRYVQKYWGVGNDTPDISDPQYLVHSVDFKLNAQIPPLFMHTTRSGLIWDFQNVTSLDPENNPYLSDSTSGAEGGISSGIGLSLTWDTRDNVFYPTRGHLYEVEAISYLDALGSDFEYTFITLNFRSYTMWNKKRVLAMQAYASFTADIPPFYDLSALGGDSRMRGYYYGRYRDEQYIMGQAEFRQYFYKRWGYVLFLGAGEVFGQSQLTMKNLRISAGAGLRYLFDKTQGINLRMDFGVGVGQHTNGVYFGLGEAF